MLRQLFGCSTSVGCGISTAASTNSWESFAQPFWGFGQSRRENRNISQVDNCPIKSSASPFNLRGKNWAQPWVLRTVWLFCSGTGVTRGAVQFQWWTHPHPAWEFRTNWLKPFIAGCPHEYSRGECPWSSLPAWWGWGMGFPSQPPQISISTRTFWSAGRGWRLCPPSWRGTPVGARPKDVTWASSESLLCSALLGGFGFNFGNIALGGWDYIEIILWVWSAVPDSSLKCHTASVGCEFQWCWNLFLSCCSACA